MEGGCAAQILQDEGAEIANAAAGEVFVIAFGQEQKAAHRPGRILPARVAVQRPARQYRANTEPYST